MPLDIENVRASLGFTIFLVLTVKESLLESPQKHGPICQPEIR